MVTMFSHILRSLSLSLPSTLLLSAETKLSVVVKDLAENHLHRVWVLDGDNKPIGVVTLRDIIDAVINTVV